MKRTAILTAVLIAACVLPLAALDGEGILDTVQKTLTAPKDLESRSEMSLANLDGSRAERRVLKMWSTSGDQRLVKFLEPAGIEGIGLLVEGQNEMYLYLPAMNKIRRIEGSAKGDDFQGTDFSYDEIGSYEYRENYSAVLKAEDAESWTLELTRKAGSDRKFSRALMVVSKSDNIPRRLEFYNGSTLEKVLTILEVKDFSGYKIPTRLRMENRSRGHYTEIVQTSVKVDQGLAGQDIFTKRFLKKKER